MLDRTERSQHRRDVHQRVEAAELRAQRPDGLADLVGAGGARSSGRIVGSGCACGHDLVVQRLEPAHDAAVQHDGRAVRREGEGQRAAEAAGRAGDEDDATGEVGAGFEAGGR